MRRIVLGLGMSIDGYIARPDGSVDFLFMPKDYSMSPFFETVDTAIMGRKTLDAALKMGGRGFAGSSMKTYVYSRSSRPETPGVTFVSEPPAEFAPGLLAQPGKDIWLMGGGELAREFLREDLVDELYLGIVPVLLGEGIRLFQPSFPQREFELTENRTFSQGLITLRYIRVRAAS